MLPEIPSFDSAREKLEYFSDFEILKTLTDTDEGVILLYAWLLFRGNPEGYGYFAEQVENFHTAYLGGTLTYYPEDDFYRPLDNLQNMLEWSDKYLTEFSLGDYAIDVFVNIEWLNKDVHKISQDIFYMGLEITKRKVFCYRLGRRLGVDPWKLDNLIPKRVY